MRLSWKSVYLVGIFVIYGVSFLMLTIGYFTPLWVRNYERELGLQYSYPSFYTVTEECDTAGLLSGQCRFPFSDLSKQSWHLGLIIRLCFYFMLAAMILVYTNAIMLLAAALLKMYRNEVFMSFLAISCGVLYPVAGILTVMSTLFVIATYRKESGFSVICCCVAGWLMLLCYVGLRVYDYMYVNMRAKRKISQKN